MTDRFDAFTGSILELNRIVQKLKDAEMKRFGLKGPHAMVLYQLGNSENGLSAVELTNLCHEDKGAMSRTLAFLVQKGIVERDPSTEGRSYRTPYHLTELGSMVFERLSARIDEILETVGKVLSNKQRNEFYDSLSSILKGLEDYAAGTSQPAGS